MKQWRYITNDYIDDYGTVFIDGWMTDELEEVGTVIAELRATGEVVFRLEEERDNPQVQRALAEAIDQNVYPYMMYSLLQDLANGEYEAEDVRIRAKKLLEIIEEEKGSAV